MAQYRTVGLFLIGLIPTIFCHPFPRENIPAEKVPSPVETAKIVDTPADDGKRKASRQDVLAESIAEAITGAASIVLTGDFSGSPNDFPDDDPEPTAATNATARLTPIQESLKQLQDYLLGTNSQNSNGGAQQQTNPQAQVVQAPPLVDPLPKDWPTANTEPEATNYIIAVSQNVKVAPPTSSSGIASAPVQNPEKEKQIGAQLNIKNSKAVENGANEDDEAEVKEYSTAPPISLVHADTIENTDRVSQPIKGVLPHKKIIYKSPQSTSGIKKEIVEDDEVDADKPEAKFIPIADPSPSSVEETKNRQLLAATAQIVKLLTPKSSNVSTNNQSTAAPEVTKIPFVSKYATVKPLSAANVPVAPAAAAVPGNPNYDLHVVAIPDLEAGGVDSNVNTGVVAVTSSTELPTTTGENEGEDEDDEEDEDEDYSLASRAKKE